VVDAIDRSYLCRLLRLALLAPELVECIMDGRQPEGVDLPTLMKTVPVGMGEAASPADQLISLPAERRLHPNLLPIAGRLGRARSGP
jgi:hypothetical protein